MSQSQALSPDKAFERIKAGNRRFTSGQNMFNSNLNQDRRRELGSAQAPYAAVLCCADSRTPPELIFDAGLGDLFVCRNAGALLDEAVLGSIEYAAANLNCPLLVVMGHSSCGAVGAAVAATQNPDLHISANIDDIVRRLTPAVLAAGKDSPPEGEWVDAAAKKSVENVLKQIAQRSPLLKEMMAQGRFRVVGAWYDLAEGEVDFFAEGSN